MKKTFFLLLILPLLGAGCSTSDQEIACAYNGDRYEIGQSFTADDGCNTCSCGQNGQIACTEMACPSAQGIDQCQTANDCLDQGIDTSYCAEGEWACVNSMCEFSCEIS
jgi:hypothetical protein